MSQATFTFRVDVDLKEAFNNAAQASDRTSGQLLRDFMREYVREQASKMTYNEWFKDKVEAGLRDGREGCVISHEESKARSQVRREELLAKAHMCQ